MANSRKPKSSKLEKDVKKGRAQSQLKSTEGAYKRGQNDAKREIAPRERSKSYLRGYSDAQSQPKVTTQRQNSPQKITGLFPEHSRSSYLYELMGDRGLSRY